MHLARGKCSAGLPSSEVVLPGAHLPIVWDAVFLMFCLVQALLKPKNEAPSTEQLVDGAVSVLEQVPNAAFSLADLLKSHSTQQSRREDEALLTRLLQRLHSGDSFAETVRSRPPVSLLAPAHLLALLCDEDPGMRRAAGKTGARHILVLQDLSPEHTINPDIHIGWIH